MGGSEGTGPEPGPAGLILYTTWPSAETTAGAGRASVEASLPACPDLMPAG